MRAASTLRSQRHPDVLLACRFRRYPRGRCMLRVLSSSHSDQHSAAAPGVSQPEPAACPSQQSRASPLWRSLAGGLLLAAVAAISYTSPAQARTR